jgi:hypothetical protein
MNPPNTRKNASAKLPVRLASLLAKAPRHIQRAYRVWREAIAAMDSAPRKEKARTARVWARRLGVMPSTLWTKRSEYRKHGAIVLLDKRFSAACWPARRNPLPAPAIEHLRALAQSGPLTAQDVIRAFSRKLKQWRRGDSAAKIPGYSAPPKGNPPAGWSQRNLARYLIHKRPAKVVFEFVLQFRADGTATWFQRKKQP